VSCYEAGREGFWLHRFLQAQGLSNHVVDSSTIEVNRRKRRAKSDALRVRKLLRMLMRYHYGERQVWRVVNAPSVEAEDQRHLHRELETLKQERARTAHYEFQDVMPHTPVQSVWHLQHGDIVSTWWP
jgi:transposase